MRVELLDAAREEARAVMWPAPVPVTVDVVTVAGWNRCPAEGCAWDERGTNGGAPWPRCGTNPPYDANGAVIPDCAVMGGLDLPPARRRRARAGGRR